MASNFNDGDGGEFDQKEEGEKPAEPPLSMEERLRLKAEMEANCKSLTELLQKYQNQEQKLKEDVAEFLIRDIEEQNAAHAIFSRVAEGQRSSLMNPDFLRWVAMHGKDLSGYDNCDVISPWTDGSTSSWVHHAQAIQNSTFSSMCHFFSLDEAGREMIELLKHWRGGGGSDKEYSKQKRNDNRSKAAIEEQVEAMCTFVAVKLNSTVSNNLQQKYVMLLNGRALFSGAAALTSNQKFLNNFATRAKKEMPTLPSKLSNVEKAIFVWQRQLAFALSVGTATIEETEESIKSILLSSNVEDDDKEEEEEWEEEGGNGAVAAFLHPLELGTNNVIGFIPAELAATGTFVRCFVVKGRLRAVEHLGGLVAVSSCAGSAINDVNAMAMSGHSVASIVSAVRRVFSAHDTAVAHGKATCFSAFSSASDDDVWKPFVVTMLVPPPSTSANTAAEGGGIVVDLQPLTPDLSFMWHFSWADVCGFARVELPVATSLSDFEEEQLVFKTNRGSLMELEAGGGGGGREAGEAAADSEGILAAWAGSLNKVAIGNFTLVADPASFDGRGGSGATVAASPFAAALTQRRLIAAAGVAAVAVAALLSRRFK